MAKKEYICSNCDKTLKNGKHITKLANNSQKFIFLATIVAKDSMHCSNTLTICCITCF